MTDAAPRGSHAVTMSDVELDAAWELLRLGPPPAALMLRSPGRDPVERALVLVEVLAGLRARGLADRDGLTVPLAGALRLMACPEFRLDLRVAGLRTAPLLGLGAVAGQHAVLITQRLPDRLRLRTMRAAELPGALVTAAGPLPPGTARSVTLDAAVFDAALAVGSPSSRDTPAALAEALASRGVENADADAVGHIYRGAHTAGQLGATGYTGDRARRAPWVVGFHRGRSGTFLQLRRPGPAGGATVTMAPLDTARLLRHTSELVSAVRCRQRHPAR